jgi:hypothetical protein
MKKPDHRNRCKGRTKQGKPCQAAATAGGLCFFHANPDKAAELGRVGGQKNRLWASSEHTSLPVLNNAVAVRETVARLISEIYAGQLHPRIGAGLGPLLNLQLRAIELTNHEQRIAALERGRMETEEKGDSDPDQESGSADPSRKRDQ